MQNQSNSNSEEMTDQELADAMATSFNPDMAKAEFKAKPKARAKGKRKRASTISDDELFARILDDLHRQSVVKQGKAKLKQHTDATARYTDVPRTNNSMAAALRKAGIK